MGSQGGYCLNFTPSKSIAEESFWVVPMEVQGVTPSLDTLGCVPFPEPTTGRKCADWSGPRSLALPLVRE